MESTNPSDKSAKLPTFDGTRSKFPIWWRRFQAYARLHKFSLALKAGADTLPDSEDAELDEATTIGRKQALAKKRNDLAIACFTMAFDSEEMMSYIDQGVTSDWPGGLASEIVKALLKEYKPEDLMSKAEMNREIRKVSMKEHDDPKTLFTQLITIENRFNKKLSLEDKLAIILDVCPNEYKSVITAERRVKGASLTIDDIKEVMTEHYRTLNFGSKDDDGEYGLAGNDISCKYCKKSGHTIDNCFKLKKKNEEKGGSQKNTGKKSGKFSRTCFHCGKKGHRKDDCFDLPENAGKRPAWYKKFKEKSNEAANAAIDEEGHVEYILNAIDATPNKEKRRIVQFYDDNDEDEPWVLSLDDDDDDDKLAANQEIESNEGHEIDAKKINTEMACMASEGKAFPDSQKLLDHPNFWIGDTAATVHMTPHKAGLKNMREVEHSLSLGDKSTTVSSKVGDLFGRVCDRYGTPLNRTLMGDVTLLESGYNLFSLTRMQKMGWKLHGDENSIWLTKDGKTIRFDIKITTSKGMLFAAYIQREVAAAGVDFNLKMQYETAHDVLGHIGADATKLIAKKLGWELEGQPGICECCAVGKAKQKSLPQVSAGEPLKEGEKRVHLDISTLKPKEDPKSMGKKFPMTSRPHWQLIVDAKSGLAFTEFFGAKNDMIEPTCALFHKWKEDGKGVTFLRMDNAGENLKLIERCKSADWKLGIKKFELTARDTPQQNSVVEVKFTTIGNRAKSMMYRANIPQSMQMLLYAKAVKTATLLDGLVITTDTGKPLTRFERFGMSIPAFAKSMRTWGEAGVVKLKTKTTPKEEKRGSTCIFIGYPDNHSSGCYLMYNPVTKGIHTSRDVTWLRRMFYDKPKNEGMQIEVGDQIPVSKVGEGVNNNTPNEESRTNEVSEDEEMVSDENPFVEVVEEQLGGQTENVLAENVEIQDPAPQNEQETNENLRRSARTRNSPERLIEDPEFGNFALDDIERRYYEARLELGCALIEKQHAIELENGEFMLVRAALGGGFENTSELRVMKYNEAIELEPIPWKKAVKEEFDRFMEHKMFKFVKRDEVPKDAVILTSTWAMKKKSNGTYRARLNGRGYEQIDGEHYNKDSVASPTINITTVRVMFVIMLLMRGMGWLIDVNGAFLLGGFENDPITNEQRKIHMEIPQGFEEFLPKGDWLILLMKTLYGTKQAAKQFWLFLLGLFMRLKYKYNRVDPCLYYKWTADGLILWSSWVDDLLCIGPQKKCVVDAKDKMTSIVDCDDTGELKEYVGCKLDIDIENQRMKITQPVLIQSFTDEFDLANENYLTPAAPDSTLQKTENEPTMNSSLQTNYRKGVGKLLHLMRWS